MARAREQQSALRPLDDPSRPLTDREKEQIARMFSEPMEFPMNYRNWVKNFIETVGVQLPPSSIVGLKDAIVATSRVVVAEHFPPGTILLGIWDKPPPGTVFADGATHTREAYPMLAPLLSHPIDDDFEVPRIMAPDGQRYAIVTGNRPRAVPD